MGRYKKTYLPQEVTGYELDPEGGMFSVVLNEATENLFLNPSAERTLTEFTARQAAQIVRSSAKQSKGTFSARCTTTANVNDGSYKEKAFTTAGTYTFSVDVYCAENVEYEIVIANTSFVPLTRKTFRAIRKWMRPHVTAYLDAPATYRFMIVQKTAKAHTFYTDGWQLENKRYPTTYCDGEIDKLADGDIDTDALGDGLLDGEIDVLLDGLDETLALGLTKDPNAICSSSHPVNPDEFCSSILCGYPPSL